MDNSETTSNKPSRTDMLGFIKKGMQSNNDRENNIITIIDKFANMFGPNEGHIINTKYIAEPMILYAAELDSDREEEDYSNNKVIENRLGLVLCKDGLKTAFITMDDYSEDIIDTSREFMPVSTQWQKKSTPNSFKLEILENFDAIIDSVADYIKDVNQRLDEIEGLAFLLDGVTDDYQKEKKEELGMRGSSDSDDDDDDGTDIGPVTWGEALKQ